MDKRLRNSVDWALECLGLPQFTPANIEIQATCTGDGEYFKRHADNRTEELRARRVSFVLFVHAEPTRFSGGELCLYHSTWFAAETLAASITPRQNTVVFFPSVLTHEILPVTCPSARFQDARLTVNGWLRAAHEAEE